MADLEILHKSARSLILRLRAGLDKLEKAEQVRSDFDNFYESTGLKICSLRFMGPLLCRCKTRQGQRLYLKTYKIS